MPYTRGQMYQICQAIEPAYNRDTMRQMTAHCMTANFDAHAGEKGFSDQLWEFASWANRKGRALELVRCAATNNPGDDALQALYAAMQTWPVEPMPATRTPTGPVALFDLAHGQTHWGELAKRRNLPPKDRPMIDIGYSEFAAMLHQRGWAPLENKRLFSPKTLAAARLVVLTLPLDKHLTPTEMSALEGYVSQDGRLLALSYYGGDDHFGTNLHDALLPFGIVLNKDVVIDGNLPFPHPSGEFVTAHPVPGQAFVADGETVHLPWCASVAVDTKVNPAAQPILVSGGDARCYRLIYAEDEPGRTLDRKRLRTAAPPVAAIATYRAHGGRVAAVGSWQAFTDGTLRLPGCANRHFLDRLLTWLLEGADDKG